MIQGQKYSHYVHVAFEKLNRLVNQLPTPTGTQKVAFSNTIWQEEDNNQLWDNQIEEISWLKMV